MAQRFSPIAIQFRRHMPHCLPFVRSTNSSMARVQTRATCSHGKAASSTSNSYLMPHRHRPGSSPQPPPPAAHHHLHQFLPLKPLPLPLPWSPPPCHDRHVLHVHTHGTCACHGAAPLPQRRPQAAALVPAAAAVTPRCCRTVAWVCGGDISRVWPAWSCGLTPPTRVNHYEWLRVCTFS